MFGVDIRPISYHLGQIYESGELTQKATIGKIRIVQSEGERDVERTPLFYTTYLFGISVVFLNHLIMTNPTRKIRKLNLCYNTQIQFLFILTTPLILE